MKGVALAWIFSMTLSTVNSVREGDGLPVPGVLVGDSVIMALLALLGEVAPTPASLAAWGFVIAQILQNPKLLPGSGLPATTSNTAGGAS